MTAHLAATLVAARPPERLLDLGCGIGSVLLFLAWRFPEARAFGVEAQAVSVALARRSIAWNGVGERVEVRDGDFRDPAALAGLGSFPLVTGTPPYFPIGTGLESPNIQRAPCRFEHRGGIEGYCEAAARALAPGGLFVACQAYGQIARVEPAAAAAGLAIEVWRDIVPRAGRAPLLSFFSMRRRVEAGPRRLFDPLVVRDAHGQRTPAFQRVREEMGMPP